MTESMTSGLIGYWPLSIDGRDCSGHARHGRDFGVVFGADGAEFSGRNSYLEVDDHPDLRLAGDFSLSLRVFTASQTAGTSGDLVGKFDFLKRRGFNLALATNAGGNGCGHDRPLLFGVDDGADACWRAGGRPGSAAAVSSLAVHDAHLYAGVFQIQGDRLGRVYRYADGQRWSDCGHPGRHNSVEALGSWRGHLYAVAADHPWRESWRRPDIPAEFYDRKIEARLCRLETDGTWTDCGEGGALALYGDGLYVYSNAKQGFYRHGASGRDPEWRPCALPPRDPHAGRDVAPLQISSLVVFHGELYGIADNFYPHCTNATILQGLFRYDAGLNAWMPAGNRNQIGATAVHRGKLYLGARSTGNTLAARMYRYQDGVEWEDCGKLGGPDELAIQGLACFNGQLYAGTVPLTDLYRYINSHYWEKVGRLERTPGEIYRRICSSCVFQGSLWMGTLPSGAVHRLDVGGVVTVDKPMPTGWRQVAAVRRGNRLELYLDGRRVAERTCPNLPGDVSNREPLRIGLGGHDYFCGRIKEVCFYNRALTEAEVVELRQDVPITYP